MKTVWPTSLLFLVWSSTEKGWWPLAYPFTFVLCLTVLTFFQNLKLTTLFASIVFSAWNIAPVLLLQDRLLLIAQGLDQMSPSQLPSLTFQSDLLFSPLQLLSFPLPRDLFLLLPGISHPEITLFTYLHIHYPSPLIDCTLPKEHCLSLSLLEPQNPELCTAHPSYSIHSYRLKIMELIILCWACHMASRK